METNIASSLIQQAWKKKPLREKSYANDILALAKPKQPLIQPNKMVAK